MDIELSKAILHTAIKIEDSSVIDKETWNNIKEAIETVLNILEDKKQKIRRLCKESNQLFSENEKKDKIIERIAYNLAEYVMYYEYDKCLEPSIVKNKAEEIIKYFKEKVENEKTELNITRDKLLEDTTKENIKLKKRIEELEEREQKVNKILEKACKLYENSEIYDAEEVLNMFVEGLDI